MYREDQLIRIVMKWKFNQNRPKRQQWEDRVKDSIKLLGNAERKRAGKS